MQTKKANEYLFQITKDTSFDDKGNAALLSASRVLQLFVFYFDQDYDKLDLGLKATQRFFDRNNRYFQIEKTFIDYFKKYGLDEFSEFEQKNNLKILQGILKDKFDRIMLERYFLIDIEILFEIRISGRPAQDVLIEKANKNYPEIFSIETKFKD